MTTTAAVVVLVALTAGGGSASAGVPEARPAPGLSAIDVAQDQERGRGDDLQRIRRWRGFLDRAHRAFFAAQMSTTAVKAKIEEADARIAELEEAPADAPGGRPDITGDVAFLERAHRAFIAAHMSTTAVKQWLAEAREGGD